jgi:beta-lactamase regulating signal transducer with metallopeptidase domain
MSSPLVLALYGFMLTMIFLNIVVFGNEPMIYMFDNQKDKVSEMGCTELYLTAISGSSEWDYAKTVFDLKCDPVKVASLEEYHVLSVNMTSSEKTELLNQMLKFNEMKSNMLKSMIVIHGTNEDG